MNHVFRVVWNRALNVWVVASELVRGRVKGASSSTTRSAHAIGRVRAAVLATLMFMPFGAFAAVDITNASFEDGTLGGWTAGGGTGTQGRVHTTPRAWACRSSTG